MVSPVATADPTTHAPIKVIGRYALYEEIASGGMATVHFGRLLGPVGFARTVAIKRLHPQFARDPEFVSMFLDEARLAARIRHPNVVPTLDVVATSGELFLVMEYVQGESLGRLVRACQDQGIELPPRILIAILSGALAGLHAAHEATNERGDPLSLVHRDISPQNILVGQDGIARVLDFGVAKAVGRAQTTREGQVKGKLAYMAPEMLQGAATRQSDLFAVAVVLWEALTGRRLFAADNDGAVLLNVLSAEIQPPSSINPNAAIFDDVVMKGLERDSSKRFETARQMALALERCAPMASPTEVGEWIGEIASNSLSSRAQLINQIENSSSSCHDLSTAIPDDSMPPPSPADAPAAHPARSSVPLRLVAGIAVLLAAMIPAVVLAMRASSNATEPAAPPASSAIPTASPSAIAPELPDSPSSASAAAIAVSAVASSSARPARVAPRTTTPSNCNPPYVREPSGRKKWKPECVGN